MKRPPFALPQSLRYRLLLPVILMAMGLGALVSAYVYQFSRDQLRTELGERGRTITNAISLAAESMTAVSDIQRFVTAMGADPGLETIVLVSGNPARVIASNHPEWNNLPLDELPLDGVAADLNKVLQENRAHYDFSHLPGHEHLFDYSAPLFLTNLSPTNRAISPTVAGAVMIHLESANIERDIITSTLKLTLVLTLIACLLLMLIYWLLRLLVLAPAQQIVEVVHRQQRADRSARTLLKGGDEIQFIGQQLDQMLDRLQEREQSLSAATAAAHSASLAKSAFLANMSHEIRTPMNAVLGFAHLLQGLPLTAQQSDYVRAIATSGEALLGLINDILDYSKIEAGRLELEHIVFDPRVPFEDALEVMARASNEKGVELIGSLSSSLALQLMGDPGRLRQVVLNLISNAIKFTAKGAVVLRAEVVPDARQQLHLQFSVEDSGIGMDEQALQRLFQPFTQADASTTRRYGGTGLGLSISRKIVESMQGDIQVASQPGVGTTFTVRIPVSLAAEQNLPVEQSRYLEGRRALLLDDNGVFQTVLQAQLQRWGMSLICCSTRDEALSKLIASPPLDLLLVDDQRPDGDAGDFCRQLQANGIQNGLPVIVFSQAAPEQVVSALSCEVARLGKPFRMRQLRQVLDTLFAPEASRPAPDPVKRLPDTGQYPLLVVEDNPINQKVIVLLLEKMGFQVELANNGLEALRAVQLKPFQLVFMDCQMPEMDGLEATRQLRASGYNTPIVALTANAFDSDRQACLDAGMNDFLSKPVMPDKLKAVLEQWGIHPSAGI